MCVPLDGLKFKVVGTPPSILEIMPLGSFSYLGEKFHILGGQPIFLYRPFLCRECVVADTAVFPSGGSSYAMAVGLILLGNIVSVGIRKPREDRFKTGNRCLY